MRAITRTEFEQAIVRNCAPTLAALKPASLFTFPGAFVSDGDESERRQAEQNRALLSRIAKTCTGQLEPIGIALRVLVWRPCGALVYVYRPEMLSPHLNDERAATPLKIEGYLVDDLDACLDRLAQRIADAGKQAITNKRPETLLPTDGKTELEARNCPCDNETCRREFPHELGYFLGYPYADVAEFIRQHGENYLEFGMWKIYTEREQALKTFARYKRCTRSMIRAYRRRGRLDGLAVRAR